MLTNLMSEKDLHEQLIEAGLMTEEQWDEIENGREPETITISKKFGNDANINQAIINYLNATPVNLKELLKIQQSVLNSVPLNFIKDMHIFPFQEDDNGIYIAMTNTDDTEAVENLSIRTNKNIIVYYSSWNDIDDMISQYYGETEALEAANEFTANYQSYKEDNNVVLNTNSPIVKVVDAIIAQAAKTRASDIHIEPMEDHLRIRYRIDGSLVERPQFPIEMHPGIVARLKVMGGMDISEKRIPQDGRITFMLEDVEYDIRVSMLPTVYGEKCVMRLAIRQNLQRDKKDLGLTPYDMKIFDKVFSNANGIILVTGPTGSGKSTTLYTALSELNTEDVNIVTVEDPVEANVAGINQVQTNARAGMTFASALRSILRQDPDIIMIGEIRDQETAEIAVQAAITGHLVVSTLHTNSSAATVTRLVNMGLPSYLVADSVVGIMAQRLVKKLCPNCKRPKVLTREEMTELGLRADLDPLTVYEKNPNGCAYCNRTGFMGRTAVYEIMNLGPEIKEMIMNNATTAEIKRTAIENGMHTLHRAAAELVVKGVTTMEEMRKVSSES